MIKSLIDTYDDQYNTKNECNTLIYRSEHYKNNKNNQAVSFSLGMHACKIMMV
jgi:hypothetical protein